MPGLVGAPGLLASYDCSLQVHLVVGSNSLAGARCTKSLEVGAKVKLIAPESDVLHYGLRQRVEAGEIEWIRREFAAEDLTMLGREEVDNVVDLVFVTLPLSCGSGEPFNSLVRIVSVADDTAKVHISPRSAAVSAYP